MPLVYIKVPRVWGVEEYYSDLHDLKRGETVIVETDRGMNLGIVAMVRPDPDGGEAQQKESGSCCRIIRKAGSNDFKRLESNLEREKRAFQVCLDRINHRRLPMKLSQVEYLYDGSKAIFYFTSEGRVDFRELVKDLAREFHTRIEMRQIGVRDEAKMLGGLGHCGMQTCCSKFMKEFKPVSVHMAKHQGLALSPTKISGLCGRLMCCLAFEEENYRAGIYPYRTASRKGGGQSERPDTPEEDRGAAARSLADETADERPPEKTARGGRSDGDQGDGGRGGADDKRAAKSSAQDRSRRPEGASGGATEPGSAAEGKKPRSGRRRGRRGGRGGRTPKQTT